MNEISTNISANELMLGDASFDRAMRLAEAMSTATVTVPAHLRGKAGDCLAIVMQSAMWGMNPFAVAQKTHLVNGTLGYESQLVNAVIQQSGAIHGRFHYEYQGESGNVSCRVGAVIKGEADITWGEWLNERIVTTKNSPLWKTNPKQQLGYLQVKNWARMYTPGAILGVYDSDELEPPIVKDMGNLEVVSSKPNPPEKPGYSDESIKTNWDKWADAVDAGKRTPEQIISMIETKATLTDAQKDTIRSLGIPKDDAIEGVIVDEFVSAMESAEAAQ